MRYLITMIVALMVAIGADAQTATEILERSSSALSKAGGVSVTFVTDAGGENISGTLKMKGQLFVCDVSGRTSWFDGKTMWTYVKANNEVNITTPTEAQVARMNPYAYLNIYKKGYTVTFGNNTAKYYEVKLTGGNKTAYESITVRLDKKSYYPQHISMAGSKGSTAITVKSLKGGQSFADGTFKFNKSKYKGVEVVDLR